MCASMGKGGKPIKAYLNHHFEREGKDNTYLLLGNFNLIRGQRTAINLIPKCNSVSKTVARSCLVVAIRANNRIFTVIINIVRDLWNTSTATIM